LGAFSFFGLFFSALVKDFFNLDLVLSLLRELAAFEKTVCDLYLPRPVLLVCIPSQRSVLPFLVDFRVAFGEVVSDIFGDKGKLFSVTLLGSSSLSNSLV
jgi:hypothetical protein